MKFSKTLLFIILTPIMILGFQNCGEGFRATEAANSFSFCKAQPHKESPFTKSSVQLDQHWFLGMRKASAEPIEIAVAVDVNCYKNQDQLLFLGQEIELSEMHQSLSRAYTTLEVTQLPSQEDLESEIANNQCIIGVAENYEVHKSNLGVALLNDPEVPEQAHLSRMGYDESRALIGDITRKVVVAVIDSGVQYTHQDLDQRMWTDAGGRHGINYIHNNFDPIDDDNDGHGTHVAGVIAAEANNNHAVAGLTGDFVEIMAVKVLNSSGSGSSVNLANGIDYAVQNGADVINISIQSNGVNTLLEDAIGRAVNAGVVVVMATGNDSIEISPTRIISPAYIGQMFEGAIAVASVDSNNGALSTFSNYSSTYAEIAAPGAESSGSNVRGILSTNNRNGFVRIVGTSQASPMVASSAAILIGYLKTRGVQYTPASVESFVKSGGAFKSNSLTQFVNGGFIANLALLTQNIVAYFDSSKNDSIFDGSNDSG
ncbi:MAG: S8 family serine peptidase, partial [Bdellovibrionales bacterium]|nr:S8 family serine peptidase [Bdellovibrionales bacterium]NQZ19334.1 S8 family serine peptidase [Bdellovibrionales bacterium]